MGVKDIEVERTYLIANIEKFTKWLEENAKLVYEKHEIDDYYTPAHRNFLLKKHPEEYLRIRRAEKKSKVTYKKWHTPEGQMQGSHCDELETEVGDPETLKKIFTALDFKYLVTVDKKRKSYMFEDFEIEIDDVKEVGLVCEIEIKGEFATIDEAVVKIKEFASRIGLKELAQDDELNLGYAFMIAKRKGLVG